MGDPIPEQIEYGNDCPACTVGGRVDIWPPGETPLYMYCYFAGLEKCAGHDRQPPNGQTFKLTQDSRKPCFWRHPGSVWSVTYQAVGPGFNECRLTLHDMDKKLYFQCFGTECPEELTIFHNQIFCNVPLRVATGGLAVIHWMGIALTLVLMMSLPSGKPIMHELFVKDGTEIIHKFCHVGQSMNVKFLTE